MEKIILEDTKQIFKSLNEEEIKKLENSTVLITGFAGSLGFMLCQFFKNYSEQLKIKKVYCVDNFIFGKPRWINEFTNHKIFKIIEGNVVDINFSFAEEADLIFHMASLASPVYYRLHPIETMDADVLGLRNLLDFYKDKQIKGLLFYSTSEIYGDPSEDRVPTKETYWGNCNTSGPRACYDESKRFGETLCYNYSNVYGVPVRVIRPFNTYGPGLRDNDKRVVADFANNVLNNQDIVIFSDGKATRTFCYTTDSTVGAIKTILHNNYDIFNIGIEKREMTVRELAQIYKEIGEKYFGYTKDIIFKTHTDPHYLTDNPQRRCPDITKARSILGYNPVVDVKVGVKRYLEYLHGLEESI